MLTKAEVLEFFAQHDVQDDDVILINDNGEFTIDGGPYAEFTVYRPATDNEDELHVGYMLPVEINRPVR